MNHGHCGYECKHLNLKYCSHCKVPYCVDCKYEWKGYNYWYTYPQYTYTTPTLYTSAGGVNTTLATTGKDLSAKDLAEVCKHEE